MCRDLNSRGEKVGTAFFETCRPSKLGTVERRRRSAQPIYYWQLSHRDGCRKCNVTLGAESPMDGTRTRKKDHESSRTAALKQEFQTNIQMSLASPGGRVDGRVTRKARERSTYLCLLKTFRNWSKSMSFKLHGINELAAAGTGHCRHCYNSAFALGAIDPIPRPAVVGLGFSPADSL